MAGLRNDTATMATINKISSGACLALIVPIAASAAEMSVDQLLDLDLKQLVEVEVSLASRRQESQFLASSAIYTLTREDIRRSGLRRIPELLRMVPGLHVARLDNNTWAISSRNHVERYSSTMLVMMDGRVLYNTLSSGVNWDVQNTYIDDIERIEVIRGPGATLWGANAVDGVINIVTRSAEQALGAELYALGGNGEYSYETGARYGQALSEDTHARVYALGFETGTGEYLDASESNNVSLRPVGEDAHDDGELQQVGFRSDTVFGDDAALTLQGDVYQGDFNADRISSGMVEQNMADTAGYNLLANWNSRLSDDSAYSIRFYVDYTERKDLVFDDRRWIYDLDLQHNFSTDRQQLTWGLGARQTVDETAQTSTGTLTLNPPDSNEGVYSLFVQDRFMLSEAFSITAGAKFEHNDFTGEEFQPSVRALWSPQDRTSVWASLARAVRTPSRLERHGELVFCDPSMPGCVIPIGDPGAESERMVAAELGFRHRFDSAINLDVSMFNHNYTGRTNSPDYVQGVEVASRYLVSTDWSVELDYTFNKSVTDDGSGNEIDNLLLPKNSVNLKSLYDINERWQFDVYLYYKDDMPTTSSTITLPDMTRLDLRLGWKPSKHIETSLFVGNAQDDPKGEAVDSFRVNTGTPASAYIELKYIH